MANDNLKHVCKRIGFSACFNFSYDVEALDDDTQQATLKKTTARIAIGLLISVVFAETLSGLLQEYALSVSPVIIALTGRNGEL